MYDRKPRIMMDSISQILYLVYSPSLVSPLFPLQCPSEKILLHVSMNSVWMTMHMLSVQEIFVCDVRTISSTSYQVRNFPVSSGSFCTCNVCTMLNRQYWGSLRLIPIKLIHEALYVYCVTNYMLKQKHLGCKKVRGQSEATLQTGRRNQIV